MFLNRLKIEEKKAFLMLAHHIANIDGEYADEEKEIISKYCMEMQMDDIEYDNNHFNLHEVLAEFKRENHKKIALLELMSLIYADGVVTEEEQEIIDFVVKEFDLNPNLAIVYREWSKSILALYIQGEALIHL